MELPSGFHVLELQSAGQIMDDGHPVSEQPDGMACFAAADGRWVLLRNHELSTAALMRTWNDQIPGMEGRVVPEPRASGDALGGVSRLVLNPERLQSDLHAGRNGTGGLESSNLVLAGTDCNCSGGVVAGGWVSCEESSQPGHGHAFLTLPTDEVLTPPRPIESWGRFHREGVAVAPDGTIYQTEDRPDGCFYRFVPEDPSAPFGQGTLQALCIEGVPHTHPTPRDPEATATPAWPDGQSWPIHWVEIPDPTASTQTCRAQALALGATAFCRNEGIAWSNGCWFSASTAGAAGGGQIFRLDPDGTRLTLELEVVDRTKLSCPDNLCPTPWGALLLCEDNYEIAGGATHQHLRCLSAGGEVFDFARNPMNSPTDPGPEFSGACFSPDGSVLFVNLQTPLHKTVAITGPWESLPR